MYVRFIIGPISQVDLILSLYQVHESFLIADMVYVVNDPVALVSPNISRMRIAAKAPVGDWVIVQDYRTKTVMGGFASVEGLVAFIGAIFGAVFGTTLLRAMTGKWESFH